MSRVSLRRPSALVLSALLGVGAVPFLASPAAADITSVSPRSGTNTGVVRIEINGSEFNPLGDVVRLEKLSAPTNTITCQVVGPSAPPPAVPSSNTKLVADCDLTAQTPGGYDVVVDRAVPTPPPNDPDGAPVEEFRYQGDASGPGFTIFGTGITISAFNPPQRGQGTTTSGATLSGTGFSKGMTIEFYVDDEDDSADPGVTFTVTGTTSTQVTGTLIVGPVGSTPPAQVGLHAVRARTADNATATRANSLNVTPAPVVTSVDPKTNNISGVGQGAVDKIVTITGTGFQEGITVVENPNNADVTLGTVTRVNSTQITVPVTVSATATTTSVVLKLTNPDNGTTSTTLAINPEPTVSSASPASRGQGVGNQTITLTGTNFVSEAGKTTFFEIDPSTGITIVDQKVDNVPPGCVTNCTQATLTVTVANDAPTGTRAIKATNFDGGTSTRAGAITINAKPTVTSVVPNSRPRGFSGTVQVNGTGFSNPSGTNPPTADFGQGVTFLGATNVTANSFTATIKVDEEAAQGTRNVTVTNSDGGSGTCVACFNVDSLTVSGAQPTGAVNDAPRRIRINGQGFSAAGNGPTVVMVPTGSPAYQPNIPGTDVVVDSTGNFLEATFDLSRAAPQTYGFRVTNANGDTGACSGCFTVANLQPVVTSVTPNKSVQGKDNLSLAIAGSNFSNGATVTFSKAGITVDSVTVNSPTLMTVVVDVSQTAATGLGNVTVTLVDGKTATCTNCFEVTTAPTVTSTSPNNLARGASKTVVVNGSGFQTGATVSFGNPKVTTSGTPIVTATTITVTVNVADDAATGPTSVTVTNPDGGVGSCASCFTVNAAPTATSVTPNKGSAGQAVPVTITGTGFAAGTPTVNAGDGITVTNATRTSETTITATFTISPSAPLGARTVTVTTADGGVASCAGCFSVVSSPTVTSINPTSAKQGTTTNPVTVNGSGFVTGAVVTFSGTGVTATGGTVSPTSIAGLTVTISPTAATGARDVIVTNPDGGTGTCAGCFTVAAGPSVTNVNPNTAAKGQSGIQVTVTGEGFASDSTVSFGSGVTVTNTVRNVNPSAADTIVATITVSPTAATGARDVTVTNPTDGSAGGCLACFTIADSRVMTVEVFDTNNTPGTGDDTLTSKPVSGRNYRVRVTAKTGSSSSSTDTSYVGTPVLTSTDAALTNKACAAAVAGVAECSANFGDLGPQTLTASGQGAEGDRIGSTMVTVQAADLEFTVAPTSGATGDALTYTFRPVAKAGASIAGYSQTRTLTVTGTGSSIPSGTVISCTGVTCSFTISFSANGIKTLQVSDDSTPSQNTNVASVNITAVGRFQPLTPARILETRGQNDTDGISSKIVKNQTVSVQVTGRGGVPATGVSAVAVNVTVTQPDGTSYLTLYPTGGIRQTVSTINFGKGQTVANLAVVKLGEGGRINVFNALNPTHVLLDVMGYYTDDSSAAGGRMIGVNPARVFNTANGGRLGRGSVTEADVTGVGGVPATGVSGVVLSVTGIAPSATTYLTVYPSDAPRPHASNLNIRVGRTVSNLVKVPVGTDGKVKLFVEAGPLHVTFDVVGYFTQAEVTTPGRFVSLAPSRIVDTRTPVGGVPKAKLGPGQTYTIDVTNQPLHGIPAASRVSAIVVNVTVADGTAKSFLTLYPADIARPGTNNVSFDAGQQAANLAVVKLDDNGRLRVTNNAGAVNVIMDVVGYYTR